MNIMKVSMKCVFLGLMSLSFWACNSQKQGLDSSASSLGLIPSAEVYQAGDDKNATWAYIGFVPRVNDPARVKLIASKKGFTMRVEAHLTRAEVENYASYMVAKANGMEDVRQGKSAFKWTDGSYATPFTVMEKNLYTEFINKVKNEIAPYAGRGFEANLDLLRDLFPDNVFMKSSNDIVLQLVYPITTGKGDLADFGWLSNDPQAGVYRTQNFEERRTVYTGGEGIAYIFAGFPAFWFNGNVGIHGPIRYTTSNNLVQGANSVVQTDGKASAKRWQLVRAPNSHNCLRMENHMEIRHILPAQDLVGNSQPLLQQVKIIVTNDYDRVDLDNDGVAEVIGVKYYWDNPNSPTSEATWKKRYYLNGVPANLVEFEYRTPQLVQIQAANPNATTARLNRLPTKN